MASKPQKGKVEVGAEVDSAATEVPAIFSNRFQVTVMGGMTRMTFGEVYGSAEAKYHSAVIISTEGMELLANLITNTIQKNKELATAKEKSES